MAAHHVSETTRRLRLRQHQIAAKRPFLLAAIAALCALCTKVSIAQAREAAQAGFSEDQLRNRLEEDVMRRMLTLQQQAMSADWPEPISSAGVSNCHGNGASTSAWAAKRIQEEARPVKPVSPPATIFSNAFRSLAFAIRDGRFPEAGAIGPQLCAAGRSGSEGKALGEDENLRKMLGAWSSDCLAIVQYIPSQPPVPEDHKRLLNLFHELALPLLRYALMGYIPEPLVDVQVLAEMATALVAMGEDNPKIALSIALGMASSATRQETGVALLKKHGLCMPPGPGAAKETDEMTKMLGAQLCALLLLRTRREEEAVKVLGAYAADSSTLHFFMSAFELAARVPAPPLAAAGGRPPPVAFSLENMLQVLETATQRPQHGLASEAHLLRWQLERMLGFGVSAATSAPSAALACAPPTPTSPLRSPRVLIAMPFVASEKKRLVPNLRGWARDAPQAPCVETPDPSNGGADFMLLLADAPGGEADSWAADTSTLLGDAAQCFGRVFLRHANLSKPEQHYIGGWDNTGPNNLFRTVLDDDAVHQQYDFVFWMETDVIPIQPDWVARLLEEARYPRGFWRKGPAQQPMLRHSMVSTHHAHMNSVGLYRLGQPCYRELMRRVAAASPLAPHDVSTHLFLHDPRNFHIFQKVAHRFLYTDFVQNRLDTWNIDDVRAVSADTVFVHGKNFAPGVMAALQASHQANRDLQY